MTVGVLVQPTQYPGNGSATTFSFPFLISASTDLVVGFITNGTYAQQLTGYSIPASGIGNSGGGQIIFQTAPPFGTTVDLRSLIPETQPTDFANLGAYLPEANTAAVDRAVRLIQDMYRRCYQFGIHGPDTESLSWPTLPSAPSRALQGLGFDANGLPGVISNVGANFNQSTFNGYLLNATSGGLRTAAEASAGVTPLAFVTSLGQPLVEGDIRRYGAAVGATDNSTAFNNALLVSSHGGSAACLPAGTWNITSSVVAPSGSSMYGAGKASVIVCTNGIDGLQFTASDAGIIPQPRFFRDFAITAALSGTANVAHGIYINASTICQVLFSNLAISNFEFAVYVQGLYYSTFFNCWAINCYHGIYFNNQSVNVWVLNCTWQHVSASTLITGTGNSTGISVQGAPEVQALHIQGGSIYAFDYNISFNLILECQIEAVDISFAIVCPIIFASTIGPLTIRDCWIELGSSASGTWNTGNQGNLTGIFVAAITPAPTVSKLIIVGNEIVSDVTISGSTAAYLGDSNDGIVFEGNQLRGFDIGIGGGNTIANVGGSFIGGSIAKNTITAGTSSILLNSLCTELTLGPNYIVSGALPAFTSTPPASLIYKQPNVPMQGTATFGAATSVAVVFTNPMPWATYHISLSGNAAGYCSISSKATTGFTITCSASNSNSVDWAIS